MLLEIIIFLMNILFSKYEEKKVTSCSNYRPCNFRGNILSKLFFNRVRLNFHKTKVNNILSFKRYLLSVGVTFA